MGPLLATVCFSPESMYLSPKGALPARGNQQHFGSLAPCTQLPALGTEADVWHLPLPSGPHICLGTLSLAASGLGVVSICWEPLTLVCLWLRLC